MNYKESVRAGPEEKNLVLTVHYSSHCGNAQNCKYPHSGIGSTPEELKKLFCYDHTFIRFKNNYRSKENFLEATIAALDNDNDHSDDSSKWIPMDAIPKLFPGIPCVISTSRHHMKQKGNRSPRPRYPLPHLPGAVPEHDGRGILHRRRVLSHTHHTEQKVRPIFG